MPLTKKGTQIKSAMTKEYGASINAGKIKGTEKSGGKKKGAKR